jgi:hypothetical protein
MKHINVDVWNRKTAKHVRIKPRHAGAILSIYGMGYFSGDSEESIGITIMVNNDALEVTPRGRGAPAK